MISKRSISLSLLRHPPLTVLNFVQKDMNAYEILPLFVMPNCDFTLILPRIRSLPLNQTSRVIYQEQIWLGSTKIFTCKIQRNLAKNRATPIKHKALLNSLAGCSAGLKKQRRRRELHSGRGRSSVGGRGREIVNHQLEQLLLSWTR